MPKKQQTCSTVVDLERLAGDLQSPDEKVRAKAVGSLCPCRVGMGTFQQHLDLLARFKKDPSPAVCATALHIFEDAGEIQSEGYPTNPREVTNEMLHRRRTSRFAVDEIEEVQARKWIRGKRQRRSKA